MNCSQVSFQIVIPAEVLLAHITLESIFPGVGEHVTLQMPVWGKQFRTVGTVELVIQGGSVARRHVSSFLHVVLHFSLHFFRILPNKGRVFVSQILQWKACREIFVLALAVILVVCCHCFAVVQLNKTNLDLHGQCSHTQGPQAASEQTDVNEFETVGYIRYVLYPSDILRY